MKHGLLATSVRALVPAILFFTALTASADGPPPTPTQSGHRLADLERYKQQGKDSYGNDLPQDPAQREQKVNEREAKIQTEKGKLDGPPPPIWTPDDQKQMRQAYLERQRHYLEQDLKAAEDKAKQAGKTGADLRRDPDVKKARQALLENENEFLRNKWSVRSAPLALFVDDECKQYAMLGSLDRESLPVARLGNPWLRPVLFRPLRDPVGGPSTDPKLHLVSDPLPPDVLREAQRQGIDHADQEFEKSQLEKIPRTSRTKEQTDRLDKLNDMLKDYENARKNPFANKDAIEAAEKAAAARRLQRQAEQLRASGQTQTAAALDAQAQALNGGQPLPPLRASAQEPLQWPGTPGGTTGAMAPTTPGGATSTAVIGQQTTYVIKGTAKMGSAVGIPKGTLATGVMMSRLETPEEFVNAQDDPKREFGGELGGPIVKDRLWFWGSANTNQEPPPLTTVGPNGDYQYDYKVGLNDDIGWGFESRLYSSLDLYQYKVALSMGYNYGCAKQSFADLATGKEMPTTAIEDRRQLIKGMKPGANLWQVNEEFVNRGLGHIQGWEPWESPNNSFKPTVWFDYKIAESDIPKFNQFASWFFNPFGPNFGINTAPAPAWKPENWPTAVLKGIPTLRVTRQGGRP